MLNFYKGIVLHLIRPRLEFGGGSAPAAPDPYSTAAAQTTSNRETAAYNAALNRYNTTTPYGSQTWTQNGTDPNTGAPIWNQNISVAPGAQSAIDNSITAQDALSQLQIGQVGQVAGAIGSPVDTSQLGGITTDIGRGPQVGAGLQSGVDTSGLPQYATQVGSGNLDEARNQAQQAIYGRQTSMLDPQYAQQKDAMDSQLANQGIVQGSKAYNDAQDNFARQRDFAYGNARNSAITGGNDYANQQFQQGATNAGLQNSARSGMFGEGQTNVGLNNQASQQGFGNLLTSGNFGNQANQQQLAQMLQLRNQPLNEYSALRTGSQVQTPQFQSTPSTMSNATNTADIANQAYQGQLGVYNADTATNNANTGAAASIVAIAAMF